MKQLSFNQAKIGEPGAGTKKGNLGEKGKKLAEKRMGTCGKTTFRKKMTETFNTWAETGSQAGRFIPAPPPLQISGL